MRTVHALLVFALSVLLLMATVKLTVDSDDPREALCRDMGGTLVRSLYSGTVCVQPVVVPEPPKKVMG